MANMKLGSNDPKEKVSPGKAKQAANKLKNLEWFWTKFIFFVIYITFLFKNIFNNFYFFIFVIKFDHFVV